jgi:hypothetical protein
MEPGWLGDGARELRETYLRCNAAMQSRGWLRRQSFAAAKSCACNSLNVVRKENVAILPLGLIAEYLGHRAFI